MPNYWWDYLRYSKEVGFETLCSDLNSVWGVGFERSLTVGRGCSGGKHHGLVVEESFDWKPVECAEERVDRGQHEKARRLKTRRAAAFWISCRGLMAQAGSPVNRELQ
jgi:hypothetical protein